MKLKDNGSLDRSFGGDGQIDLPGAYTGTGTDDSLDISPGGIIYYALDAAGFAVASLLADGSKNLNFGTNGIKSFADANYGLANHGSELAGSVAFDARLGRIFVGGTGRYDDGSKRAIVAALRPDGQPDASFGSGGVTAIDFKTSTGEYNKALVVSEGRLTQLLGVDYE